MIFIYFFKTVPLNTVALGLKLYLTNLQVDSMCSQFSNRCPNFVSIVCVYLPL